MSGRIAVGMVMVVGPATLSGKTRGKMTVGLFAGLVNDGSLIVKGAPPAVSARDTTSKKTPKPARITVSLFQGRYANPMRGAKLFLSVLSKRAPLASTTSTKFRGSSGLILLRLPL